MIDRKINPLIIVALINYYNDSLIIVENECELSKPFKTNIGVKQGGAISPKLFSIYVDELIRQIETDESGTKISLKLDIIVYADDILLLSTSKKGLQDLIDIAETYGEKNDISYNPEKTVFMIFNKKTQRPAEVLRKDIWQDNVKLNGIDIKQVKQMKYLGVEITDDNKHIEHLEKRKKSAMAALLKLKSLGLTGPNLHPVMKGHLYKTYVRPVLLYGIESLYLTQRDTLKLKRIEGIPTKCKTTNLMHALKIEPTIEYVDTNTYTRKIVEQTIHLRLKDIINELTEYGEEDLDDLPLKLEDQCKVNKYVIKSEIRSNCKNNPIVTELITIFNSKNRDIIPDRITQLIRYDA
ncbi:RNA-directed DNA polymerase from mobile element jockey-like [Brachionus plicatilis]|uniref:RNA-directed DNA polymerase from mobile element jockey-like n=1 Tax=Brachionus plicatilis TaxID=10195 RepID=A0A3M7PRZ8_BRAPC|nr:RNA-directed DNA polymerase from mobile element jockey-like [Brachionus plicatilis]